MARRGARTTGKPSRAGTSNAGPGRLRIVAGIWRSRLLDIADVAGLRPTAERVRETLFNWLAPRIEGARCLDLFAGTGALGLEALSRGAREAVLVEKSPIAARALRRNVAVLGAEHARVVQSDAFEYLDDDPGTFDIVFLDPPFAADLLDELCRLVAASGILAKDARVYLEQDAGQPDPSLPDGWQLVRDKKAGQVRYLLVAAG